MRKKTRVPMVPDVLPDGVPVDNSARASFSGKAIAPDTATPEFTATRKFDDDHWPGEGWPKERPCGVQMCRSTAPCTFDGCWRRPVGWTANGRVAPAPVTPVRPQRMNTVQDSSQNLTMVLAVVALAMAMGAVFLLSNPTKKLPLCSEQPEWNQYNCRTF